MGCEDMIGNDTSWMVGWGERGGNVNDGRYKDPRAKCWTKVYIASDYNRRKEYLLKMFKLYRSSIPVSSKTHFIKNGWCSNKNCTNPFHHSARGGS